MWAPGVCVCVCVCVCVFVCVRVYVCVYVCRPCCGMDTAQRPDAQKYFNACSPADCTTRRVEKMSAAQVISVVLGLLGGLSVTLRTIVGVFYNVTWSMCFQNYCRTKTAATAATTQAPPPPGPLPETMQPIHVEPSVPVTV